MCVWFNCEGGHLVLEDGSLLVLVGSTTHFSGEKVLLVAAECYCDQSKA